MAFARHPDLRISENAGRSSKASLTRDSKIPKTRHTALRDVTNKSSSLHTAAMGKAGTKPTTRSASARIKAASGRQALAELKPEEITAKLFFAQPDVSIVSGLCKAAEPIAFTEMVAVDDIDSKDHENPQLCAEYVQEIYHYMRQLERKLQIQPNFLSRQREISSSMRAILVDWLVQVQMRFKLLQETLYVTIAVLDRYLQKAKFVSRTQLQLVGVTSMLIASKYEETYAPEVMDFVYITDNAYTAKEVREMECEILNVLEFELGRPFCLQFLRRNSKAAEADAMLHTAGKYLMELTLPDADLSSCAPSLVAAASLYLSMKLFNRGTWSTTVQFYSGYTEAEIRPCARKMASVLLKSSSDKKLTAVNNKYESSKFMRVSTLPELSPDSVKQVLAFI